MDYTGFTVNGLDKLVGAIEKLTKAEAKKAIGEGIMPALEHLKTAVESEAPVRTGTTRDAVTILPTRAKGDYVNSYVSIGEGAYRGKTFAAAFVEFGFRHAKTGEMVPPNPFMERAFNSAGPEALRLAEEGVLKAVEAALK